MSAINVSSGVVSSGLVADGDTPIYVYGGTVTETTIDSYGVVNVISSGGIAENTLIKTSAGMYVSSGGQCRNTVLEGRSAYLGTDYDVVYVTGTTVNSGGSADLGATWITDLVVNTGGYANIYGGTVHGAAVYGVGHMWLHNSNTIAYDMIISGSGSDRPWVSAWYGGTIQGATVGPAYLIISSGGKLNDAVLESGGVVTVLRNGAASNTTIDSGGHMSISGGSADQVTVNSGGWLSAGFEWGYHDVSAGVGATRVVENGGAVYVETEVTYTSSWDSASSRYVSISSTYVFPVEFASNTFSGLTYADNFGTVHSGTTAVDIKTSGGGGMTVFSGGIVNGYRNTPVTWTSTWSGWEYTSHYDEESGEWIHDSTLVSSSADVTTVGGLTVSSGGRVTGLVAQSLPGLDEYSNIYMTFQVAPGTVISGTIDGVDFNLSNGQLSGANVKDVTLQYMSGGFAHDVTQVNGSAAFDSRSYAYNMVYSGTEVNISRGAAVDKIKTEAIPYSYYESPMSFDDEDPDPILIDTFRGGSVKILAGATVTNMDLNEYTNLRMQVAAGTVVAGTSGGVAVVQQGGVFANASLGSTYIEVLGPSAYYDEAGSSIIGVAGGTAANLIVNMGAEVTVSSGGIALDMTENGGAVFVEWNYVSGVQVPAGTATFASNTFSYDRLEGEVTVHKNTVAQDNVFYGGNLAVYSGGVVNNFYTAPGGVGKGGGMVDGSFEGGAIISNFDTVRYAPSSKYHPGSFGFGAGIQAAKLRLTDYDGIGMTVDKDTVITNASLDNIPFAVVDGVLSGFHGDADGWFSDNIVITDGGRMVDCYINAFGQITIEDGASADNLTIANNYLYLQAGTFAENVTVGLPVTVTEEDGYVSEEYNNAMVYVYNNAVIRDFTVNEGSTIEVFDGGKATGEIRLGFESGTLNVYGSSAIVEFDLTDKSALSVARVDNLTSINMDGARYEILVDAEQAAGQYVLADYYWSDVETKFYLVGVSGSTYGYFLGEWVNVEVEGVLHEEYQYTYYKESSTQPGYNVSLDRVQVEGEEGAYTEKLVLTVDSTYSPVAWLPTPTVTTSINKFTNADFVLTATADGEAIEYSLDGTTWQAYAEGGLTVTENGKYYFRAVDRTVVSDVATFTVSNLDKVAPTLATNLSVSIDEESVVTLRWTDATDEFSGVKGYNLSYWKEGEGHNVFTASYINELSGLADGTWHWSVQTVDYAGNLSETVAGADFILSGGTVTPAYVAKADIDGNGVSDVLFQYTGGDYQLGYWMNGTNAWRGQGLAKPAEWEVLGSYDMNNNGNADAVLVGNVEVGGVKGAYIGYYLDSVDTDANWQNIGYLNNADNIGWKNKVGNLTGTAGANSIVWYAPELYALGAWTDGTDSWVSLSNSFGGDEWTIVGMGDFAGIGRDAVLMTYNKGQLFYAVDYTGITALLGSANWAGWDVRAIGDFSGDSIDDIILFHKDSGSVVMLSDGNADYYKSVGQLDANDWFVVGAGDYNGDQMDDLLVRQYSTGMLGYYTSGDMSQWNVLGYGVDMNWTVIA